MKYLIANWKANKNLSETRLWITEFLKSIDNDSQTIKKLDNNRIKIIICPPFPLLFPLKQMLDGRKNIVTGCQDISLVEGGTYTGEVTAHSIESFAEYVIIGHSERKKFFQETEDEILKKFSIANKYAINPIYCVATENTSYPSTVKFLCYEPPAAISGGDGHGNFESVQSILNAKQELKVSKMIKFIYGGSVNRGNVANYINTGQIDGFLIGGASLDPIHFYDIVKLA